MAADLAVRVLDGDVGRSHLQFAGNTDCQDAGFLAEAGFNGLDYREVPLADQLAFFLDSDAVLGDVETVPLVCLGEPFDDQRLDAESCQHLCRGTAGV